MPLPVLAGPVRAGFPSPAEDYVEGSLDLNQYLIRHPAATFIMRVAGESMIGAGIFPGDLLVVDRSIEPVDGHVVIAQVDGELTVKRLEKIPGGRARAGRGAGRGRERGTWRLVAEHPDFAPIVLESGAGDGEGDGEGGAMGGEASSIWGVVTCSVRMLVK